MADKLREELFKLGHILPSSDEEIEELDKVIKKRDLPKLPEIFSSPSQLLKEKEEPKIISIKRENDFNNSNQFEPMARVAREGSNLPDEILARMKKDRQDAEQKQKGDPSGS